MSIISTRRLAVNALTLSRVPTIGAFAFLAVWSEFTSSIPGAMCAAMLLVVSALSDLFDGMLARRWQVVSTFGKMADPLMDKVFFIVSFPTLLWLIGHQGESTVHAVVMLVFTVLYILRDQWVTFLRAVASAYHADVSAMWLGKVRTALSFPAAGYVYLYLAFHARFPEGAQAPLLWSVYAVEGALILLNVYSSIVYTRAYWPYVRRSIGFAAEEGGAA